MATLFMVATPLGNLADISARAAACLRDVAIIYAEDTRRSRILLDHLGIARPLRSLHEHNEGLRRAAVLEALGQGDDVAILTDAGTPAVSDPGAEVVAAAHAAGFSVSPVPGPSAVAAALSVAGFLSEDVLFVGFLPRRPSELKRALANVARHTGVAVLFESPQRLGRLLAALARVQPERRAVVCRELTKVHEQVRADTLAGQAQWAEERQILGEITLVLGPYATEVVPLAQAKVDEAIQRCLEAGLSVRDTATAVAAVLQLKRREVYACCRRLTHSDAEHDAGDNPN